MKIKVGWCSNFNPKDLLLKKNASRKGNLFTSNADILSSDRCGSVTVTAFYDPADVTGARVSRRDMWVSWSVNKHCGCE